MKKLSRLSLIALVSSTIFWLSVAPSLAQAKTTETFVEYLRYLASDEMKGRGNGTPELEEAARYIAELFRDFGLVPAGEEQTYFQEFELGLGRAFGPNNQVTFETGTEQIRLQVQKDYFPLTSGPDAVIQGPLVFAGFGISAPELNYDNYKDLDVEGKIVLVFEHEPQEQVEDSLFAGKELTPYATVLHKIVNAKERGAAGVILLSDSFNHPQAQEQQPGRAVEVQDMGIPSLRLTREWSERLLQQSGRDSVEIADRINSSLTPFTFALGFPAVVSLDIVRVRRTVRNVLGLIPGETDSVIVLGAHYDHLGLGTIGSLAPEARGQVHNGADDNASGTAGLLQLAQDLGGSSSLKQGVLFIAFAGEELGLLGSRYYTENPTIPLEKTTAMINLDMIGRSEGDLSIIGVRTRTEFSRILNEVQRTSPLQFSYSTDMRGSSDHMSFSGRNIPVLFFFSGLHGDYHRPSDDWERINVETTGQVLDVVRGTLDRLQELNQPLAFVEVPRRSNRTRGGRRQRRPWFGSLPDTSWSLGGVRFEQILSETPAAEAGLKDGDVLVLFDGQTIDNLRQFLAALEARSPGDEVQIAVFRKGELIRTTVRLATRY